MKQQRIWIVFTLVMLMAWGVWAMVKVGTVTAESPHTPSQQTAPFPDQRVAVQQSVAWLVTTHQNDDGGYTSFSSGANAAPSDVGGTADAMLAIAAAGYNPAYPAPSQESTPFDYLRQHPDEVAAYAATDGSTAGKLVMALVTANQNPRDFVGHDFVISITQHLSPTGQFGVTTAFGQSLAILGLRSVGGDVPPEAIQWLTSLQATEGDVAGSWDDGFGTAGNADATAMAVMALVAAGLPADDPALLNAADFLTRSQLETGGWEYGAGFGANANSTALAIQALKALGQDVTEPMNSLLGWQSVSGAFQADFGNGRFDDFYTTVQAIPAALGKTYPLPGRAEAVRRAVSCLADLQDPASGAWEQFPGFGINAPGTARAIQAIAAAGVDPNAVEWMVNGNTPLQVLESLTPDYLTTSRGGGLGTILLGVAAANPDAVHNFAGQDLELTMAGYLSPTGEYDSTAFGAYAHAKAMLGLLENGLEVDETAVSVLLAAQTDGDWGGADTSGAALQVAGRLGIEVPGALEVLHNTQLLDGGWGFDASSPSSSSEVVQGLIAYDQNPFDPSWSQVRAGTVANAADFVMAGQLENGCWANLFGPGDDVFSTVDAVLLLAQQPTWLQPFEQAEAVVAVEATVAPTEAPTELPTEVAATETAVPTEPAPSTPTVAPTVTTETAVAEVQPTAAATQAVEETAESNETAESAQSGTPAWLWVIILVVVGGVVAAGVWYMRK